MAYIEGMNHARMAAITEAASMMLAPRLRVVCTFCGKFKEYKACAPEQDGQLSHGLHEECKDDMRKAMGA